MNEVIKKMQKNISPQLRTGLESSSYEQVELIQMNIKIFKEKFYNLLADCQKSQTVVTKEKIEQFFKEMMEEMPKFFNKIVFTYIDTDESEIVDTLNVDSV